MCTKTIHPALLVNSAVWAVNDLRPFLLRISLCFAFPIYFLDFGTFVRISWKGHLSLCHWQMRMSKMIKSKIIFVYLFKCSFKRIGITRSNRALFHTLNVFRCVSRVNSLCHPMTTWQHLQYINNKQACILHMFLDKVINNLQPCHVTQIRLVQAERWQMHGSMHDALYIHDPAGYLYLCMQTVSE